ncbi:MAG TPA: hypothetical protein VKR31_14860 [Rhizomicrobium sp.]|nr:hypothetical protein [Rhizomicrobium sp.]
MRQPFGVGFWIKSSVAVLALTAGMRAACADVVISNQATKNMDCAGDGCEPTAPDAVLNVTELEDFISQQGNVTVFSSGRNVEATNIVVKTALATPDTTALTFDAAGAIIVDAPVSIGGSNAELQLQSETGGTLGDISFGPKGHISFGSTSDLFDINGGVFQLVDTLPELANLANAEPSSFYALTNSYDASADGTYHSPPVSTTFTGYFEALGNTISNLKLKASTGEYLGLFAGISGSGGFGVVRNLRLENASVVSDHASDIGAIAGSIEQNASIVQSSTTGEVKTGDSSSAGGVVGEINLGSVLSSWSSANVSAGNTFSSVGGLVGAGSVIRNSWATGTVTGGSDSSTGGLVGLGGAISKCFATGEVITTGGGASAGGLVGDGADVNNSYAEGSVSGTGGVGPNTLGGLIGYSETGTSASYATGTVTGSGSDLIGGLAGMDISHRGFTDTYWDTTTSGLAEGVGRSNNGNDGTPLTSRQLRSGLPAGFKPSVWRETGQTNHGFPWLRGAPPPK